MRSGMGQAPGARPVHHVKDLGIQLLTYDFHQLVQENDLISLDSQIDPPHKAPPTLFPFFSLPPSGWIPRWVCLPRCSPLASASRSAPPWAAAWDFASAPSPVGASASSAARWWGAWRPPAAPRRARRASAAATAPDASSKEPAEVWKRWQRGGSEP